ncbi:MAG: glycosyltransferase family 39 protein, partial [bacterium]
METTNATGDSPQMGGGGTPDAAVSGTTVPVPTGYTGGMSGGWMAVFWLVLLMIFALAIRYHRLDDPFGGYHSFNEGWYSAIARNYDAYGLMRPVSVFGTEDYNVAPFYSYLLYFVKELWGESERNYRMVSAAFSLAAMAFVFMIGRLLFSANAGLAAAALFGFAPVSVVVGRNVQTDSTYAAFMLACLYFYLSAGRDRRVPRMAISGLCFGFAFFTKQFAVLLLPAVFIWECAVHRGLKWLDRGHAAFAACAALVPAPFLVYHLVVTRGHYLAAQWDWQAVRFALPVRETAPYVARELLWGVSPPVAALFIAGLAAAMPLWGRHRSLLVLALGVFLLFFTFWRGHSYYMLSAVPFAALLAGDLLARKCRDGAIMVTVFIACGLAAIQTLAFLCSVKYGYGSFKTLSERLDGGRGAVFILSEGVAGNYRPALHYYLPHAGVITEDSLKTRRD